MIFFQQSEYFTALLNKIKSKYGVNIGEFEKYKTIENNSVDLVLTDEKIIEETNVMNCKNIVFSSEVISFDHILKTESIEEVAKKLSIPVNKKLVFLCNLSSDSTETKLFIDELIALSKGKFEVFSSDFESKEKSLFRNFCDIADPPILHIRKLVSQHQDSIVYTKSFKGEMDMTLFNSADVKIVVSENYENLRLAYDENGNTICVGFYLPSKSGVEYLIKKQQDIVPVSKIVYEKVCNLLS